MSLFARVPARRLHTTPADIIVDDQVVSNRHCLIFAENKDEQPIAVLEDMSSNGTFVNDAIVGRNQRRELKEHDEIAVLRDVRFVFKYPKSRKSSPFQEQYEVLQKLGKGHFAEVYMCVERSSGQRYAVKVFTKRGGGAEDKSRTSGLQQEIAVLMGVNHPNVLCLKDTFDEPDGVRLILELAPEGELFNFIIRKQKLSETETRKLFLQLFNGVKYLHERNIVHRDIKPENILLVDDDLHVKLADFGLAKIIGDESFTTTLCGTPSYVAPEILAEQGRRKYTKAVDIWSLGVVLYICLCGFPPFSEELTSRQYPYSMSQQIREGRFDYPSPYWDSVGDPACEWGGSERGGGGRRADKDHKTPG
jgi:serine/threonine-protein kinase Chk2